MIAIRSGSPQPGTVSRSAAQPVTIVAVLGLLIGVFFGWALVLAMKDQGITVFSIPVVSLIVVVVLAALAGLLAAIPPSRRAAKLNILKAIVSE